MNGLVGTGKVHGAGDFAACRRGHSVMVTEKNGKE
jgi:hypothetical protein